MGGAGRQAGRHLRPVLGANGRDAPKLPDYPAVPGPDASWSDCGGYAPGHSSTEAKSHAGYGKPDSSFHHLHSGVQTAEGRDVLRDGSAQGGIGIFYHQRRERETLSTKNPWPFVRPHGRVRSYGERVFDFGHHHDFRNL